MVCSGCWTTFQDTFLQCIGNIGLVVYVPVLVVLIRYSKTTFKRPFFTFCISLGFVEIVALLSHITQPAVFYYMAWNKEDRVFQRVYGGLSRIAWFAVLYHQVYIAMERMTALLYPKLHDKLWTFTSMCCHYTVIIILSLASNLCITTTACEYVLYDDGVTNFYNFSVPGAALHNRIVDLGIQPCFFVAIVLMYLVTGMKVIKLRKQIRAKLGHGHDASMNRKRRLEIMLVLQGFLVSAPQIITMALYHILIYVTLPPKLFLILNFISSLFSKLVFASSPFLYLLLNTDIRVKMATMLAGKAGTVNSLGAFSKGPQNGPGTVKTAAVRPISSQRV